MKPYDKDVDYCGPGKGVLAKLVTNTPWGGNINLCCYRHDKAYEEGGTGEDREHADKVFRACVYKCLVAKWWIPAWLAGMCAERHYVAVRVLGSGRWNYKA